MAKIATREAYGQALAEFGEVYKDIVVLDADLSKSTRTEIFKKKFPDRFFNIGIAEQDLMATAAGLATCGKIPFASTFAVFAAGRAYDQVRNSIGYPHLNVKIGASHAGVSIGEDGASHQMLEDIALMRVIPGMVVLSPSDAVSTYECVRLAIEHEGPVYIRLGRLGVEEIYKKGELNLSLGKGIVLQKGTDVGILATGLMVHEAIKAAKMLQDEGISVYLVDMPCIKPIDIDLILDVAKMTGCIVTAEEHNILGGFGSAVSEVLIQNYPVPVKMVGVNDEFGRSGKPEDVLKYYKLTAEEIVNKAKEVMKMKR
ncbi:Transketolase, central region [Caldicellulosiruptor saccharolyticus DSM 8903]|uniref:Transketolase, central region n=1 Tax=Caldicellulosiruptor saccharolyticus (strain ATCC 43494 / DSM 8903 / Tp8T 6331) TaxID=351627 RepID=A4XJ69_CALS8|nr:transketolase family protein [Caldicellulosiruptor saccharolyticus]ABP66954.1 Transketolase, central region [Caldicellulosiruptor saccharolyticus DSM 8903]